MSSQNQTKGLPTTTGRWAPIYRGKTNKTLVGWLEVFGTRDGRWHTVPGASRFVEA